MNERKKEEGRKRVKSKAIKLTKRQCNKALINRRETIEEWTKLKLRKRERQRDKRNNEGGKID